MNLRKLCFSLFDGEGGSSAGGEGGLGAEASAFMASLDQGNVRRAAAEPEGQRIEYGYGSDGESAGPVGSVQENAPDIGAEFAELIGKGGKYHEAYGQHVAEAIQNRFKNNADYQAQLGSYDNALAPLYAKYGLDPGDIEGISRAIASDIDFYTAAAEREGISPEMLQEQLALKAQAKRGQMIEQEYQRQQQYNQNYARWEAESEGLREAFPNFDLGLEMQNEEFAHYLEMGSDVKQAFMMTHFDDIMRGMNQETSRAASQQTVANFQARQARPMENGLRTTPPVVRKTDPSKFTDADMDEIFRRVENGEKIRF